MRAVLCLILIHCFFLSAEAQVRSTIPALMSQHNTEAEYTTNAYQHKLSGPRSNLMLSQTTMAASDRGVSTYWASKVTTQSYGNGKWGTYYYWDVQGNLRDMRGFIDIAGKNKRGLKLVFPWR
ncbi:MAG TPA: hypothetical protein DIS90_07710 [Cytophagales bacterium]|nr:hypothetical protein [Cytophagales bacterium]HCR54682.1 hypothetical protein [Cytophagales bacterium]